MQGRKIEVINGSAPRPDMMEPLDHRVESREPVCTTKRKQRGISSSTVWHLHGGERATLRIVVSCLVLAVAVPSALADAYTDCSQEQDRDREIRGCSEIISKGLETKEDLAKAYNNRGAAYGILGDYDRAIADFTRAIGLTPEDADTYNYRGHAYRGKRDYDRAIADFGDVIRLTPHGARAYNNRGAAYGTRGDHDRAIADFTEAIGLSPENATAYRNRGNALSAKGDYNGAIADFSAAIHLDPANADGYNGRAWTYFKAGRAAEGLPDAQRAVELAANDAQILDTRAHIYEAIGLKDDAVADYGRALSLDPSHQGSKEWLKRLGVEPPPLDKCIGPGSQCPRARATTTNDGKLAKARPAHWHLLEHQAGATMAAIRVT